MYVDRQSIINRHGSPRQEFSQQRRFLGPRPVLGDPQALPQVPYRPPVGQYHGEGAYFGAPQQLQYAVQKNNHLSPRSNALSVAAPLVSPNQSQQVYAPVSPQQQLGDRVHMESPSAETNSEMNLTKSGSPDSLFSDEDSSCEYTNYTLSDEEPVHSNLNCMNSLFFSSSKKTEGGGLDMIRCNQVGQSTTELHVNLKLPHEYMDHLVPTETNVSEYIDRLVPGSKIDSAMNKWSCKGPNPLDKKCDFNYSQQYAALDEDVVDVDPYKQFRDRIAPQFYESLFTEDSEGSSDEEDGSNCRPSEYREDLFQGLDHLESQVQTFGTPPKFEGAMHFGIPEPPLIGSPPSQIFIEAIPTVVDDSDDNSAFTAIELSIAGTEAAYCQPNERVRRSSGGPATAVQNQSKEQTRGALQIRHPRNNFDPIQESDPLETARVPPPFSPQSKTSNQSKHSPDAESTPTSDRQENNRSQSRAELEEQINSKMAPAKPARRLQQEQVVQQRSDEENIDRLAQKSEADNRDDTVFESARENVHNFRLQHKVQANQRLQQPSSSISKQTTQIVELEAFPSFDEPDLMMSKSLPRRCHEGRIPMERSLEKEASTDTSRRERRDVRRKIAQSVIRSSGDSEQHACIDRNDAKMAESMSLTSDGENQQSKANASVKEEPKGATRKTRGFGLEKRKNRSGRKQLKGRSESVRSSNRSKSTVSTKQDTESHPLSLTGEAETSRQSNKAKKIIVREMAGVSTKQDVESAPKPQLLKEGPGETAQLPKKAKKTPVVKVPVETTQVSNSEKETVVQEGVGISTKQEFESAPKPLSIKRGSVETAQSSDKAKKNLVVQKTVETTQVSKNEKKSTPQETVGVSPKEVESEEYQRLVTQGSAETAQFSNKAKRTLVTKKTVKITQVSNEVKEIAAQNVVDASTKQDVKTAEKTLVLKGPAENSQLLNKPKHVLAQHTAKAKSFVGSPELHKGAGGSKKTESLPSNDKVVVNEEEEVNAYDDLTGSATLSFMSCLGDELMDTQEPIYDYAKPEAKLNVKHEERSAPVNARRTTTSAASLVVNLEHLRMPFEPRPQRIYLGDQIPDLEELEFKSCDETEQIEERVVQRRAVVPRRPRGGNWGVGSFPLVATTCQP